jgi:hypothetical protein
VGDFGGSLVQTASSGGLYLDNSGATLSLVDAGGHALLEMTYGMEAGEDQSITRDPDVYGAEPLAPHASLPQAAGAIFSPGTQVDGLPFSGEALGN